MGANGNTPSRSAKCPYQQGTGEYWSYSSKAVAIDTGGRTTLSWSLLPNSEQVRSIRRVSGGVKFVHRYGIPPLWYLASINGVA
jgi:hypothetical protein